MLKLSRLALAALLTCSAPAAGAMVAAVTLLSVSLSASEARADEHEIKVGTELMATTDVTLHKAEIAKGSKVSVTKVLRHGNRVDGVSVALADGHVVKISLAQMHTFFRVVGE